MTLREIWESFTDAFTRDYPEMYDICLDTLRIMASNSLGVHEILPSLIEEGQRLHFLRVAYFLEHELLAAAYRCYGCELDFELARHLVACIESGWWPTCEVAPSPVLDLTEALSPQDDV